MLLLKPHAVLSTAVVQAVDQLARVHCRFEADARLVFVLGRPYGLVHPQPLVWVVRGRERPCDGSVRKRRLRAASQPSLPRSTAITEPP